MSPTHDCSDNSHEAPPDPMVPDHIEIHECDICGARAEYDTDLGDYVHGGFI